MTRSAGYSVENNFVNGLVTEATGLNFPESAVTETDNCVFDENGSVRRRDGLDREPGWAIRNTPAIDQALSEYVWESVAGDGNRTFLVQQVGSVIDIFNVSGSEAISQNLLTSIDLLPYATNSSEHPLNIFQYASGIGKLLISSQFADPVHITYDPTDETFSVTRITIETRDLRGVLPYPVGRSSTLTDEHWYNLLNQGWDLGKMQRMRDLGGTYPSDYDVWWLYKTPDALGTEVFLTDIAANAGVLDQVDRGNSPAPKGSIILTEFYQDRSAVVGFGSLPVVSSNGFRPVTVAFHAGRAFYAGVNYQEFSSKIYFSQIIETKEQFGKCYQQNDPTTQYSPDLLPTDGGVISIPEVGTIYRLWSIDTSLLVFASAGTWQITGSSGIGFSATDYTVKKISSVKTLSPHSFVNAVGIPMWWGLDAIYAAVVEGTTGSLNITPVSDERIKTFYDSIPEQSKLFAKGAYNSKEKLVQWVYRDQSSEGIADQYSYNRILNFNTTTRAFYPWSLPTTGGIVKGIVSVRGSGTELVEDDVLDNSMNLVTDNLEEVVTVLTPAPVEISAKFKYLVKTSSSAYTYGQEIPDDYGDWASFFGGVSVVADSFFVTGYKIRGQGIKKAQSNYVRLYNKGKGAFLFRSRWDYTTALYTNRWSSDQIVQFGKNGYEYQTRRLKMRGHGLAFQYDVRSWDRSPFEIIGWASFDTANERP